MNFFKESTQFKNWIYNTKQEVDMLQISKFERGLKILAELNRDLHSEYIKGENHNHQKVSVNLKSKLSKLILEIIQPSEEKEYIIYYTHIIKELIMKKTPSRSLKTYTLSFFRRFYLRKTTIDYDPDFMISASLFLGFKIAQMSVNMDVMKNICPFLKEKHKEKNVENILLLLEYEFYLINVINYEFYVFCPYKAMVGFINTLTINQNKFNLHIFSNAVSAKEFELKCENMIDLTFLTDLIFLYTYSYIALSCIHLAADFFNIKYESIKILLKLENLINYTNFINNILPTVKENINKIKILSDEEFALYKRKILKFLNKNPKYVEKLEKDRS